MSETSNFHLSLRPPVSSFVGEVFNPYEYLLSKSVLKLKTKGFKVQGSSGHR